MASVYVFDGERLRAVPSPEAARRLRWIAWQPDGEHALLAGNRGHVLRFDGKRFEVLQIHWWRVKDGKIVFHRAVRDDLGMMQQLGLVHAAPPK